MYNNQYSKPVATLSNKKTTLEIMDLPAKLGRNNLTVDVYFYHESISREHCLFEFINGRFTVRDLGSTAGTSINRTKLEANVPYYIEDGDKIAIGKVKFTFRADPEEMMRRSSGSAGQQNAAPAYSNAPEQNGCPMQDMGMLGQNSGRVSGGKTVTVPARELNVFEYDANEIIHLDCGLKPAPKPAHYTQDIAKKELSAAAQGGAAGNDQQPRTYSRGAGTNPDTGHSAVSRNNTGVKFDNEETVSMAAGIQNGRPVTMYLSWVDEETGAKGILEVDKFPFFVGRKSDENDFVISKTGASRKHFHFTEKRGECCVCDDNSSNGVLLNGSKITAGQDVRLSEGDIINAARVTFTVERIS